MTQGIWVAAGEDGLLTPAGKRFEPSLLPDATLLAVGGGQLFCASALRREILHVNRRVFLPSVPGLRTMAVSQDGAYVYALSGDGDSLACIHVLSAQMHFLNNCGCYPQDIRLHPTLPHMVVAGGATGEILFYDTPGLTRNGVLRVPGIASNAVFANRDLLFLSAVENGDIATFFGVFRASNPMPEELALYPGIPGSLCALNDGTALLSYYNTLLWVRLRPYKVLYAAYTPGLVTSLAVSDHIALICDSAAGTVYRMQLSRRPHMQMFYEGNAHDAIFAPNV